MSELSEKRTSKFFNRALPDPPSSQNTTSAETEECPKELNNLYELIPHCTSQDNVASQAGILTAGETYEDIDNCLERGDLVPSHDSSSSRQSSTSRSSSLTQRATQNPTDDEYLEPVIAPEEEVRNSSKWRPSPAPRFSLSTAAESQQTSYVNAEMISTALPSLADGFAAMMKICRETLKLIAERLTAQYMTASWPTSVHLEWSNFDLSDDGKPRLTQQHVSYYRARHATLAPKGCVLMVCPLYLLGIVSKNIL